MYSSTESGIIVADSFQSLSRDEKILLLRAAKENWSCGAKSVSALIKSVGEGVYNKLKTAFSDPAYRRSVEKNLQKNGIFCVTIESECYPERLKEIPVPPLVLYCRGNAELLKGEHFAIVGSRRTPSSTLALCRQISGEVAQKMTVVTGIADGADSAALKDALASGKVVCVLPGGHNHIYPSTNVALEREVERKGLVISEFPPETGIKKYMFVVRNRIIAGLSRGVLVVSAAERSGALITARYAVDYDREVFAFPHSIGVKSGEGCNKLIKEGAALCRNVLDIFEAFGLEYKTEKQRLSEEEQKIAAIIRREGKAHAAELSAQTGMAVYKVIAVCSSLEIKGIIAREGGNMFSAVK